LGIGGVSLMKEESALLGIDNLYLIGGLSPSNLARFWLSSTTM
jgi:hypothetical protein